MNIALIKKYKAEFDHWLDGGNVQAYYKIDDDPKWWTDEECEESTGVDNFNHIFRHSLNTSDVLIVIDDEYVEFRKAGADGKQLQVSYNGGKTWFDKSYRKISWSKTQLVRIKPEEPKFKVGDWVRDLRDNSVFQINTTNFNLNLSIKNTVYTHWKPERGELCWFWNFNEMPTLEQFSKYHDLDDHLGNYETLTVKLYQHCEPFIGELPSNLKNY